MATHMRLSLAVLIGGGALLAATAAKAESCYDLWYERNAIYNDYGYCFKSALGKRTFDNSDCYTSHANLSRSDQQHVDRIRREEKRRGCKVNR